MHKLIVTVGRASSSPCRPARAATTPSNDDQSPDDRLAEAKTSFDDAEYIGFTHETDNLPDDVDGLVSAEGTGTHDPAFTGKVDVQTAIAISADLIAVDGKVYAELPIVGWQRDRPGRLRRPRPGRPDGHRHAASRRCSPRPRTPRPATPTRDGSEVLTTIDGTIPGDDVKALFPSAGTDDFDVTYTLTDDNDIEAITVTGPFYGDATT